MSSGADKQSQVHDELLMAGLRDAFLTVERTLIERGQLNTVRQTRPTFQETMFSAFLDAVEGIAGRQVCSYVSESVTSPELILEIFYLEPTADVPDRLQREAAEDAGALACPVGGIADKISNAGLGGAANHRRLGAVSVSPGRGCSCRGWR